MKTLRLLPLFVLGLLNGGQAATASPQASTTRPASSASASDGIGTAVAVATTAAPRTTEKSAPLGRSAPAPRATAATREASKEVGGAPPGSGGSDASGLPGNVSGYGEVEWIRTPRPQAQQGRTDGATQDNALDGLRHEASSEWTVELSDRSFRQTLLRWTRIANWQLVWEVDRDFAIDAQVTLNGNFLDALNQAMTSLRDTDFPVQARINPDTRVVRVVRYMLDGERR